MLLSEGSSNVIVPSSSLALKPLELSTLADEETNILPLVARICCISNSYTLRVPLINRLSNSALNSLEASFVILHPLPVNPLANVVPPKWLLLLTVTPCPDTAVNIKSPRLLVPIVTSVGPAVSCKVIFVSVFVFKYSPGASTSSLAVHLSVALYQTKCLSSAALKLIPPALAAVFLAAVSPVVLLYAR